MTTARRLLSLALLSSVIGLAVWPGAPSSRVSARQDEQLALPPPARDDSSIAPRFDHGGTASCSTCHFLGDATRTSVACREGGMPGISAN